jgi:hypothetical protein
MVERMNFLVIRLPLPLSYTLPEFRIKAEGGQSGHSGNARVYEYATTLLNSCIESGQVSSGKSASVQTMARTSTHFASRPPILFRNLRIHGNAHCPDLPDLLEL